MAACRRSGSISRAERVNPFFTEYRVSTIVGANMKSRTRFDAAAVTHGFTAMTLPRAQRSDLEPWI